MGDRQCSYKSQPVPWKGVVAVMVHGPVTGVFPRNAAAIAREESKQANFSMMVLQTEDMFK